MADIQGDHPIDTADTVPEKACRGIHRDGRMINIEQIVLLRTDTIGFPRIFYQ